MVRAAHAAERRLVSGSLEIVDIDELRSVLANDLHELGRNRMVMAGIIGSEKNWRCDHEGIQEGHAQYARG
jgi:hypothetical protein